MKTVAIRALPGEGPYSAVKRVVREVEKVFDTELEVTFTEQLDGTILVEARAFVHVVVTQTTEAQWKQIRMNLQAIAERALRGDP